MTCPLVAVDDRLEVSRAQEDAVFGEPNGEMIAGLEIHATRHVARDRKTDRPALATDARTPTEHVAVAVEFSSHGHAAISRVLVRVRCETDARARKTLPPQVWRRPRPRIAAASCRSYVLVPNKVLSRTFIRLSTLRRNNISALEVASSGRRPARQRTQHLNASDPRGLLGSQRDCRIHLPQGDERPRLTNALKNYIVVYG